jgi:hypothetical protein
MVDGELQHAEKANNLLDGCQVWFYETFRRYKLTSNQI